MDYAISHDLVARPGFKEKKIVCYAALTADGQFIDLVPSPTGKTFAPDIGGKANGTSCCNIVVEKALYPLAILTGKEKDDKNTPKKLAFYLTTMREAGEEDAAFKAVADALSDADTLTRIRNAFLERYKPGDPMGFIVDGQPIERSTGYLTWWDRFRSTLSGKKEGGDTPVCLITGKNEPALETVPKISGLMSVGGHTAGDAFLCYDKDAFTSYGLKKSANAPVSEEGMIAVNAALTKLIAGAPTFGGAKMVYWYDKDIPHDDDPLWPVLDPDFSFGDDEPGEADEQDAAAQKAQREADMIQAAQRLIGALDRGEYPAAPAARYYILPMSGMSGRVMVRGWYEGSFERLYRQIGQWYSDLQLTMPGGSDTRPPKLKRLAICLLKPGGDPRDVFKRMDDELSALLGRVFYAVVNGGPLPDEAAVKALYALRSDLLASSDTDGGGKSLITIYQVLKVWLVRKQRMKGAVLMGKKLNTDYPSAAYQCGRLMAVYGAIQTEAMGRDLGVGVIERYYGSAIVSPKLVLGSLSRLCNYHLGKIENTDYANRYRRMLMEISAHIEPGGIPDMLTTEQQTEFALGYYQQNAAIYTKAPQADEEEA